MHTDRHSDALAQICTTCTRRGVYCLHRMHAACALCSRAERRTLQLARLFMVRARRGLSPLPAWPGVETTMQTVQLKQ